MTEFFRSRAKKRARPWRKAAPGPAGEKVSADPIEDLYEEAKILDSVLEGALQVLPQLHIPGRFGQWLARFPIDQVGNDRLVAEFESYLSAIVEALHSFTRTAAGLPAPLLDRLDDVGLGPASLATLLEDPRLTTRPRPPKRRQLQLFLVQARERVSSVIRELEHQSQRAYR